MKRYFKQGILMTSGLFMSGMASAHTSILHDQGFFAAILHYITGLDHWLVLFAIGLLLARYFQKQ